MSRDRQFDPVLAAQAQIAQDPPVGVGDLDILFTACIQSPTFFDEVRRHVQPHYFESVTEAHFGLLWRVLCDIRDRFRDFVYGTVVELCCQAAAGNALLSPQLYEELLQATNNGIIYSAFATPPGHIQMTYARDVLRRFLLERSVIRPIQQIARVGFNGSYAAGFGDFLAQIGQHSQRISSIAVVPRVVTAPSLDSTFEASSTYHVTGLPFIDGPLGGQREGDVNGLVGVTGGGKSTLGAHLVVSSARTHYALAMQSRQTVPLNALFTYEESGRKIYPRIQSAGMQIRRSKLERMRSYAELTTRANLEEYERGLVAAGGEVLSERERWQMNEGWLNTAVAIYDMSGSEDFPAAGYGHVPEMANALDMTVQQTGQPVRTVVIDWAGLVCQRHMEATNADEKKLREELTNLGDRLRREIAEKFSCTVWLVHQLRGEAGAKSPLKLMHHTDAAESKSFAVHLASVGCLGVPDPRTGCRRLNWSKIRYTPQEQATPVTLRIHDTFAVMEDVTSQFGVDDTGGGFVRRDSLDRIAGTSAQRQVARGVSANPPAIRGQEYTPSDGGAFNE